MRTFGLIGKSLSHSFSYRYFQDKFRLEKIQDAQYLNFELFDIEQFTNLIQSQKPTGLNVTIPYKVDVIPFLDKLDYHAEAIGAVNTIAFANGILKGYNTDWLGFKSSLPQQGFRKAAILGTGGASKAVQYALHQENTEFVVISRSHKEGKMGSYNWLNQHLGQFDLIVNCTPLGTHPDVNKMPHLNTEALHKHQLLYDLIYNPTQTKLLKLAKDQGCKTQNGYSMLVAQAEAAWKIWNESHRKS